MEKGKKIVFYTPQDEAELKSIAALHGKERTGAIKRWAFDHARGVAGVTAKVYTMAGKSKPGPKGPRATTAKHPDAVNGSNLRVSKNEINIPIKSVEMSADDNGQLWLKARY